MLAPAICHPVDELLEGLFFLRIVVSPPILELGFAADEVGYTEQVFESVIFERVAFDVEVNVAG